MGSEGVNPQAPRMGGGGGHLGQDIPWPFDNALLHMEVEVVGGTCEFQLRELLTQSYTTAGKFKHTSTTCIHYSWYHLILAHEIDTCN